MGNNISVQNNPVLTEVYRGYVPEDQDFIQEQIFPTISVGSETGDIIDLGTTAEDFLRIHNTITVGRTKTPEIKVDMSKSTAYKCEKNGLKILITEEDGNEMNNKDWRAGKEEAKIMFTEFLKTCIMIGREYALASALFNTSNFTNYTTLTGADQFSDFVNSDPIGAARTARQTIRAAIGKKPNVCIMGETVFSYLQDHPQIKRTNGVAPDGTVPVRSLTEAEVAKALGVTKVIVGGAQYETKKLGITSSRSDIWGKYMLFAYINPSPKPRKFQLSLGYKFEQYAHEVDDWDVIDPKNASYVRSQGKYDDVLLDETAGYLIAGAVA